MMSGEENSSIDPIDSVQRRQRTLPNSGGILAMGIISIVFAGLLGMILAIIALSLSGKSERAYYKNPELYREGSYKNLKAGKICATIGIFISIILLLFIMAIMVS